MHTYEANPYRTQTYTHETSWTALDVNNTTKTLSSIGIQEV